MNKLIEFYFDEQKLLKVPIANFLTSQFVILKNKSENNSNQNDKVKS